MTTSTEIGRFDVALDGVGYMAWEEPDTAFNSRPAIQHQSVRTQRDQSVAQGNIGESTVNPLGFWRRSIDGWHHGAGQTYYDRAESDSLRFRTSQGVDVFGTRHQLGLLNKVSIPLYTFGDALGFIMLAGTRLYLRDGNTVKWVTGGDDVTPWTTSTVTGTSTGGNSVRGLATDGSTIYIAYGANGIYTTTASTSSASSFITGTVQSVFYVKGRLIAINGADVFNPVAAGALPSALLTLPTGFVWGDVTGGPQFIYMLASNGSNTVVYKTTIKADGTALDVPTIAGQLPEGQVGVGIYAYADRVFVASRTGIQMAEIDANGNLVFGSRIPITATSYAAFEGEDRFVWGANPDATGNGLLKMDLSVETLPNTPAYAPDLRAAQQAGPNADDINAVVTYNTKRIFVAASRAFVETSSIETTGHLDSGLVALDLADAKTPISFDVEAAYPSTSSITEALSTDRGATFTTVDTFAAANNDEAVVSGISAARQFEIRTTLTSAGGSAPTLYRHTLKVEPNVDQDALIQVKLNLYESVVTNGGGVHNQNPDALRVALEALQASRAPVTFQQGSTNYTVTVRDLDVEMHAKCAIVRHAWNSMATVTLKVLPA